jgi:predicted cupin superfamily sugar epimerase
LLEYDPAGGWLVQHVLGDVRLGGGWQGARTRGDYSLVGSTVAPGFEFEDFRFVKALPGHEGHFTAGALARFADLL